MSTQNKMWTMAKVVEITAKANKIFNLNLSVPHVEFYNQGRTAGLANYVFNYIKFNEVLMDENIADFEQVIGHEIAHLFTHKLYPYAKQAHGPEFKWVIAKMGFRVERCHSFDLSSLDIRRQQRIAYCCPGCNKEINISTTKHNRMERNETRYISKCCSKVIVRSNV